MHNSQLDDLWLWHVKLFNSNNLGVVAALQRCPTPRLFAGVRLRRLSIVPIC